MSGWMVFFGSLRGKDEDYLIHLLQYSGSTLIGLSAAFITSITKKVPFFCSIVAFLLFYSGFTSGQHFHWLFLLPVLCISAGLLITDLLNRIGFGKKHKKITGQMVWFGVVSSILVFDLVSTTLLITTNLNVSFFELQAVVVKELFLARENESDNMPVI